MRRNPQPPPRFRQHMKPDGEFRKLYNQSTCSVNSTENHFKPILKQVTTGNFEDNLEVDELNQRRQAVSRLCKQRFLESNGGVGCDRRSGCLNKVTNSYFHALVGKTQNKSSKLQKFRQLFYRASNENWNCSKIDLTTSVQQDFEMASSKSMGKLTLSNQDDKSILSKCQMPRLTSLSMHTLTSDPVFRDSSDKHRPDSSNQVKRTGSESDPRKTSLQFFILPKSSKTARRRQRLQQQQQQQGSAWPLGQEEMCSLAELFRRLVRAVRHGFVDVDRRQLLHDVVEVISNFVLSMKLVLVRINDHCQMWQMKSWLHLVTEILGDMKRDNTLFYVTFKELCDVLTSIDKCLSLGIIEDVREELLGLVYEHFQARFCGGPGVRMLVQYIFIFTTHRASVRLLQLALESDARQHCQRTFMLPPSHRRVRNPSTPAHCCVLEIILTLPPRSQHKQKSGSATVYRDAMCPVLTNFQPASAKLGPCIIQLADTTICNLQSCDHPSLHQHVARPRKQWQKQHGAGDISAVHRSADLGRHNNQPRQSALPFIQSVHAPVQGTSFPPKHNGRVTTNICNSAHHSSSSRTQIPISSLESRIKKQCFF